MADIVGHAGLPEPDRRALHFADRFERELVHQEARRSIQETFDIGWRLLASLPRQDLVRLSDATIAARYGAKKGGES